MIKNISQLYSEISATIGIRKEIAMVYTGRVCSCCFDEENAINNLRNTLNMLQCIKQQNGKYLLELYPGKNVPTELRYELSELERDIYFLENGEEHLIDLISRNHLNFRKQVDGLCQHLRGLYFRYFIADRDGTINNYSGWYKTSVQAAYNAVFVSRFALRKANTSIILTSAPLSSPGITDLSVNPEGIFIYAGSKGREFIDISGKRHTFPIEKEQKEKLKILNQRLEKLLEQEEYQPFALIGSGLQYKFGQTAIARQDIYQSIKSGDSLSFKARVESLVQETDPDNSTFHIHDTGLDLEIILKNDNEEQQKNFDKGQGILYLEKELSLDLTDGWCLVCGDTHSDLAMLAEIYHKNKQTFAVFVTRDAELQSQVSAICPNCYFVTEPDILVVALNELAMNR